MTAKHDIEYGETLTSIAKKYNTTPATLFHMNSNTIKDMDLIYANDSIEVPLSIELGEAERAEPINLPITKLREKQCTIPTFVDALLVPRDPNESNQTTQLILLNEDAKAAVAADHDRCIQALVGDKESVIKQLNKLGVMDQFNSVAHEHVLELKGGDLHLYYKEALWTKKALSAAYRQRIYELPKNNANIDLDIDSALNRIEKRHQERLDDIQQKSHNGYVIIPHPDAKNTLTVEDAIQISTEVRARRIRELQKKTIKKLAKTIAEFEREAIQHAKTLKTDDGIKFGFDTNKRYYTANEDLKIEQCLKTLTRKRKGMGLWTDIEEKELTVETKILSLSDSHSSYQYWKKIAHPRVLKALQSNYSFSDFFKVNRALKPINFDFYSALHDLNQMGYYVKEQSLTEDDLFLGYKEVDAFIQYAEEERPSIEHLLNRLAGIDRKTNISNSLGYYCAYVLNLFLLQVIAKRLKEFTERFGQNKAYGEYVRRLFSYKEQMSDRCEALREQAELNPGVIWDYRKSEIIYLQTPIVQTQFVKKTLWFEHHFSPRNLNNVLISQVKIGQRTIVECALSSDPQNALYILSDNPVLSSDFSKNSQCTRKLKLNNMLFDERAKDQFGKALKGAFGAELSINIFKMAHGGSWEGLPDALLAWQSDDLFGTNNVETCASAQFARYVFSATSALDSNSVSSKGAAIKTEFVGGLEAASAQVAWKAKFPTTSQELRIPYLTKESNEKKEASIGKTQLIVEGKLYGAVAASVKIGTELHIGNISPDGQIGNFGVVGRIPMAGDYDTIRTSTSGGIAGKAVGSTIESKAFAGLEVGGQLSGDFRWEPLVDKNRYESPRSLFKVATGLKMTAGIGVDGLLQCTYQNGRFVFILAYSQTQGIGFGGKVATELNPKEAGDFFAKILEISKASSFKRFLFFDESGDVDAFAAFNVVLTVATSYGLTLTQVLALPFNIIADMETLATDKANGHFVANFLNDGDYLRQNKHWIENMPAETLAKLLDVLCHYNDIPSEQLSFIESIEKKRAVSAINNQSQRKAINKIFGWMCNRVPSQNNLNRFENALQRVGLDEPTQLDKNEQWQRYVDNVIRLREFFEQAFEDQYQDPSGKDDYMLVLSNDYAIFKNLLLQLTERVKVMQRVSYSGYLGVNKVIEYNVYQVNGDERHYQMLKEQGYKLTGWMNIK